MRFVSALWGLLLNALFPPVCASCKSEGDFLCASCLGSLAKRKLRRGARRGKAEFQNLSGVVYALDYAKNPQIRAAIRQFKYRFTEELAEPFARLVAEKIGELEMAKGRRLVLVPVPLHAKRFRERGFNQAEVVAEAVRRAMPESTCEVLNLLERPKETLQQARLGKAERELNLRDAFILNKKIVHKVSTDNLYFVVDDVCTTGSTLDSCAKVLKSYGVPRVYGLVIARSLARDK